MFSLGLSNTAINGNITGVRSVATREPSLRSSICNATYIVHLFWLFIHALRFVTFIGLLNVWLEKIFHDDEQKGVDRI